MTERSEQFEDEIDFDVVATIPTGVHEVIVYAAELAQGPKAPYIAVTFTIRNGEFQGTFLYDNITLSANPSARRRTKVALEAILGREIGKEDIRRLVGELRGKACRVDVNIRDYNGESRPEIVRVLPLKSAFVGGSGSDEPATAGNKGARKSKGEEKATSTDELFGSSEDVPF